LCGFNNILFRIHIHILIHINLDGDDGICARVAHCLNYFYDENFPFSVEFAFLVVGRWGIVTATVTSTKCRRHAKTMHQFEDARFMFVVSRDSS